MMWIQGRSPTVPDRLLRAVAAVCVCAKKRDRLSRWPMAFAALCAVAALVIPLTPSITWAATTVNWTSPDNSNQTVTIDPPSITYGTYYPTQSGSEGDDEFLDRVISEVHAYGGHRRVVFPHKTYELHNYHEIGNFEDIELDFNNSIFVFLEIGGKLLWINKNTRVSVKHLTITWNNWITPIFGYGRVRSCVWPPGTSQFISNTYTNGPTMLEGINEYLENDSWGLKSTVTPFEKGISNQADPNTACWMSGYVSCCTNTLNFLQGRAAQVRYHVYSNPGMILNDNSHVTLDRITFKTIPGFAMSIWRNDHIHLNHILVQPDYEFPVYASAAGGGIITTATPDLVIENSDISGQGDDGLDVGHVYFGTAPDGGNWIKWQKPNTTIPLQSHLMSEFVGVGKTVALYNINHEVLQTSTIEEVSVDKLRVRLSSAPNPNVVYAMVTDYKPVRIVIRNNVLHDNRARGMIINAQHALIENNLVYRSTMAAMISVNDPGAWAHGPDIENMLIRNNEFYDLNSHPVDDGTGFWKSGMLNFGLVRLGGATGTPPVAITHLKLQGNVFGRPYDTGIFWNGPWIINSTHRYVSAEDNMMEIQRVWSDNNWKVKAPGFGIGSTEAWPRFRIYRENGANRAPLYLCHANSDEFLSLSSNCDYQGGRPIDTLGYIGKTGTTVVSSCNNSYGDRYFAIHGSCDLGGTKIGTLGYESPFNRPPSVSLTSPSSATQYMASSNLSLTASASDDVEVTHVEFYNGSTLLFDDTKAPFEYTWPSVSAGTYTIKAKAYDGNGLSTDSSPVTVRVVSVPNAPTNLTVSHSGLNISLFWTGGAPASPGVGEIWANDGSGWSVVGFVYDGAHEFLTYATAADTIIEYKVRFCGSYDWESKTCSNASSYSNTADIITFPMPAEPSIGFAFGDPTHLRRCAYGVGIGWDDPSGSPYNEIGYYVYRSYHDANSWTYIGHSSSPSTIWDYSAPGGLFDYQVQSYYDGHIYNLSTINTTYCY